MNKVYNIVELLAEYKYAARIELEAQTFRLVISNEKLEQDVMNRILKEGWELDFIRSARSINGEDLIQAEFIKYIDSAMAKKELS